jgi:hypothetical protein
MLNKEVLEAASEVYKANFDQLKGNLKFSGKSLEDWCSYLAVSIEDDLDFQGIIDVSQEIDKAAVIAHNNLTISYGVYKALYRSVERKKAELTRELVEAAVKRKSIAQLETEVTFLMADELDRLVIAEFIVDFWREQIKLLDKRNKVCETLHWNLRSTREVA